MKRNIKNYINTLTHSLNNISIVEIEEVAKVLKYKTLGAVRKAHSRKTLPVKLYRFKGRAGYYARAEEDSVPIYRVVIFLRYHHYHHHYVY